MMSSVPSTLESRRNHPVQGSTRVVSPVGSSHRQAADTNTDLDRELLESLRLGEPAAAEYLITRYGGRAYRLAVRICGNVQDAEEAVQDAFWSVVRNVASFRGEGAFSSWLYRIVVNAAHQKLRDRRGGRTDVYLDAVLPCLDEEGRHVAPMNDWSVRLEDRYVHAELGMILTSALEELPAAGRTAVVLHHVEGMSSREIAEALNITVANVKARLHRARLFLRKTARHNPWDRVPAAREGVGPALEGPMTVKTIEEPATVPVGGSSVGGLPEWRLRRMTQYIGQNLQGRLRLEELSAVVHMSPYHFAHLFKKRTGVSPHRFVRQQRIERARALLVTPPIPVSAVARSVGFRSASHFSTTFRRITGFTPSSYRRSRQALPPGLTDGPDPDGRGCTSESRIPRDVD